MKIVPKFYIILTLLLAFLIGCRNAKENTIKPETDQTSPLEKLRDSSDLYEIPELEQPVDWTPGRAKKNLNSELDTLRPIKA